MLSSMHRCILMPNKVGRTCDEAGERERHCRDQAQQQHCNVIEMDREPKSRVVAQRPGVTTSDSDVPTSRDAACIVIFGSKYSDVRNLFVASVERTQ